MEKTGCNMVKVPVCILLLVDKPYQYDHHTFCMLKHPTKAVNSPP